jgi:hypothetical protein
MVNHPNRRRVWLTSTGTVCLRDDSDSRYGEPTRIREFWVPEGGGTVLEIDQQRPNAKRETVCAGLAYRGNVLHSTRAGLLDLIRTEYRRARAHDLREMEG